MRNGRPASVYQQGVAEVAYTYDSGRLTQLSRKTKQSGGSWQYQYYNLSYNNWGQRTTFTVGSQTLSANTYEPNGGNLEKTVFANGQYVQYTYDEFDRKTQAEYNNGRYIRYFYNAEGSVSRLTYGDGTTEKGSYQFEYDSLGRLIRSAEYDGGGNLIQRTEQKYDAYNRLSSQKWVLGTDAYTESYTYDDGTNGDGSLKQMTTGTGDTIDYTYNKLKQLEKTEVKNTSGSPVFNTAYAYRAVSGSRTSAQVEFRNVRRSSDNELLEGKKYDYDSVGNIIQISQSTGDYYPLVKYEYDSQNQLISEIYYDGEGSANTNITSAYYYTYDTAGNLRRVEEGAVGTDGTITKTVIQTYTYSTGGWKDLLTTVNDNPIAYEGQTYDADTNTVSGTAISGNPTNYPINGTIYDLAWENGRQLSSISKANRLSLGGRWTVSFEYDSDGIRTKKQVPHGRIYMVYSYITQNGKVVRQSDNRGDAAKVLDFIYDESDRPFALIYTNGADDPVTYYYVLNLQGDVVGLVDENGVFVAQYTYNAWGEILDISGDMAAINPLRYRGYYYDTETGWYYLQSRYYDPVNHRFINADSYASTDSTDAIACNMFAYCENNPILNVDSNGHRAVAQPAGNPDNPFFARPEDCNSYKLLKELNKYRVSATGLPFDFSYWSGDNILNARFSVISYTKKYSNEESVVAGIASAVGDVCTLAGGIATIPVVPIPKIAAGGITVLGVVALFVGKACDNGCDVPYSEYTFYNVTFCWEETERYGTAHNEYTYTWTYAIPTCVDPSRGIPIMYQLINGKPCQIY